MAGAQYPHTSLLITKSKRRRYTDPLEPPSAGRSRRSRERLLGGRLPLLGRSDSLVRGLHRGLGLLDLGLRLLLRGSVGLRAHKQSRQRSQPNQPEQPTAQSGGAAVAAGRTLAMAFFAGAFLALRLGDGAGAGTSSVVPALLSAAKSILERRRRFIGMMGSARGPGDFLPAFFLAGACSATAVSVGWQGCVGGWIGAHLLGGLLLGRRLLGLQAGSSNRAVRGESRKSVEVCWSSAGCCARVSPAPSWPPSWRAPSWPAPSWPAAEQRARRRQSRARDRRDTSTSQPIHANFARRCARWWCAHRLLLDDLLGRRLLGGLLHGLLLRSHYCFCWCVRSA